MTKFEKIQGLNKSFQCLKEAIDLVKEHGHKSSEMDLFIWRLEKDWNDIHRAILIELNKEGIDFQFKKLTDSIDNN